MSHDDDDCRPPRRYGTDSSLYSCTNLEDDERGRHIKASEVRRQIDVAPEKRYRMPAKEGKKKGALSKYPETFNNLDGCTLQGRSPWNEYPVVPESGAVWRQEDTNKLDKGKVRGVWSKGSKYPCDVIYHDEQKSMNTYENFTNASYRDREYVARERAYEREYDERRRAYESQQIRR